MIDERPCRGWGLASRRPGLTAAEQQAGEGHARLCRRCRERRAAQERARAQLVGGTAGAAGGLVAGSQLVSWGGTAGALVGGKAAAGVIGALGAAVLATAGAAVAVQQTPAPPRHPAPAATSPAAPRPQQTAPREAPAPPGVVTRPSVTPTTVPALPLPGGRARPSRPAVPGLPVLPTLSPLPLPEPPAPLLSPLQGFLDVP